MTIEKKFIENPSPWHPDTNSSNQKYYLKLMEELAEALSATARCQMQGIDEAEPSTGKINREWLEEELADVVANIHLVTEHFNLDGFKMMVRVSKKIEHLSKWHKMA